MWLENKINSMWESKTQNIVLAQEPSNECDMMDVLQIFI